MTVGPAGAGGLRERKKQRTRDALARAALELFTTQGFEETTVDEIAEAADVSQRTFFRYYASKLEVAFAVQEAVEEHFLRSLRSRPPEEAPFEALRNSTLAAWDTMEEVIAEMVPVELHMRTYLVIESTPALLAAHIRRSLATEETISRIVAEREGLDADADPRPRLAVAAMSGALRVAARLWSEGSDHSVRAIRELAAYYLDHLTPALIGPWRD
ncbi:TetR family transcriptional regulator [Streptomyces qinzhouensis]|uniref:TetR family transcriptional regulator n=1 Tax=Streptomyces qinzhouensis TaxID=2599401 RepID=A0A5B8J5Q8_9ACTN|nr:TetR family transcriptional regulator [Streptomyces qinzhouensis]QDY76586.1 TetR family transcriptional regulator [Streptomyces qinzhouensis]